jgi:hypothetical protein
LLKNRFQSLSLCQSPETELPAEDITPDLVPEVESDIEQSSEVSEEVTALAEELLEETILRPIGGVLTPVQDRAETAVITPGWPYAHAC